jgi:glycosyltransferase involved in cell wall biosynthesis
MKLKQKLSIVTVAMNRNAQLLQCVESISQLPFHSEHLIVDWSSTNPIKIDNPDPRIKIIRVKGETRWHLTKAYNFAFKHASYELVFKCDADVIVTSEYMENTLRLLPFDFALSRIDGYAPSKADLVGQFFVQKSTLESVGGFNEYITGWGYDDTDLFVRIMITTRENPLRVVLLNNDLLMTKKHSSIERFGPKNSINKNPVCELFTSVFIRLGMSRANKYISKSYPWNSHSPNSTYRLVLNLENYSEYVCEHCSATFLYENLPVRRDRSRAFNQMIFAVLLPSFLDKYTNILSNLIPLRVAKLLSPAPYRSTFH